MTTLSLEEAANEQEFSAQQFKKTHEISVSMVSNCPKFDLILPVIDADGHIPSLP